MNKSTKKIVTLFAIVVQLTIFTPRQVDACFWDGAYCAEFLGQSLDVAYDTVVDVLDSVAKQLAIQEVVDGINSALGDAGGVDFIENFDDYLIKSSREDATETVLNNFMRETIRGRSPGDYVSASSSDLGGLAASAGANFGQNYIQSLIDAAEIGVTGGGAGGDKIKAVERDCDISGNGVTAKSPDRYFECFAAVTDSNPIETSISVRAQQQALEQELQFASAIKASSDGTLPIEDENGNIVLSQGVASALQEKALTAPIDAIINSDSSAISSLASAVVSQYITEAILQQTQN